MKRNAKSRVVLATAAMVCGASSFAGAAVISGNLIYSDSFGNSGSQVALSGHTPDVADLYGASWVADSAPAASGAPDAIFVIPAGGGMASVTNGSANPLTTEDTNTIVDAFLPVSIVAGDIYDYNVSMAVPTVNSGGHGAEMAFIEATGFNSHTGPTIASNGLFGPTQYPDLGDGSGALNNLGSYGMILQKDTNVVQMFGGLGTANQNSGTLTDVGNTFNNFDIVLNTEGATWTTSQYLNGVLENTANLTGTPAIGFIGLAVNRTSGNFDFSLTQIPEPSCIGLLTLGAMALAKRRRAVAKAAI